MVGTYRPMGGSGLGGVPSGSDWPGTRGSSSPMSRPCLGSIIFLCLNHPRVGLALGERLGQVCLWVSSLTVGLPFPDPGLAALVWVSRPLSWSIFPRPWSSSPWVSPALDNWSTFPRPWSISPGVSPKTFKSQSSNTLLQFSLCFY